jgi:hypothetical protein
MARTVHNIQFPPFTLPSALFAQFKPFVVNFKFRSGPLYSVNRRFLILSEISSLYCLGQIQCSPIRVRLFWVDLFYDSILERVHSLLSKNAAPETELGETLPLEHNSNA